MIHSENNKAKTERTAAQTLPKTHLPMMSMMTRITKHIEEQEFATTFKGKNDEDQYFKLEIAMKYLDKTDSTKGAAFYFERSREIMQHLHKEFQKHGIDEVYLPWVRYLDISARKKEEYPGKREGSQGFLFKQGMEELIIKVLFQNQSTMIDWRIAKKILSLPNLFPEEKSQLLSLIQKDSIFKAVQGEIGKSLEQMIWLGSNSLLNTAKKALEKLAQCCRDESCRADLIEAFISGRIDKVKFGLSHSLILGEDGGFYLLLNRLTKDQQEDMITENIVTRNFLKDKISKQKAKDERAEQEEKKKQELYGEKVIIGKGGFGSVKFAVSLFNHNGTSPGDVICIKKTRNFTILSSNGGMMYSSLQQATEATIGDYFASSIADKIYAPQIFDLAIVSSQLAYKSETDHRKGYLMMEIFPQNTATRIFEDTKYQKWIYQKPYLLEVLRSTLSLFKENIAFTDLKPDNTLYDTNILKATFGGTIKIDSAAESFEKSRYSFQTTPKYRAPEMGDSGHNIINGPKALAYTCGQLLKEVVQNSDYSNTKELQALIEKLTQKEPDRRITIQEAIDTLEKMGEDSYKEDVVFRHYIAKVQERIENNRSSISLNEDILETKQLYINQSIASQDPEKYNNLDTEDLFEKIDNFFLPDQKKHQVMVVFGAAGSGKSIALQLKFIEAVRNWNTGQPLPIYFNLANGIELKTIIDSMNRVLGTHITFQDLGRKGVHLYIDSFDEGLEHDGGGHETLTQEYMKDLCPHEEQATTNKVKFIISCRTEYLASESNYKWFTPQINAFHKLLTVYIAPIDYRKLSSLKEMISIYAKYKSKDDAFAEKTQKKIEALQLKEMITTGFMFYIILEVVSELKEEECKDARNCVTKQEIFQKYVSYYQERELKKYNEDQKSQLRKIAAFIINKKDQQEEKDSGDPLNTALRELGKYIAVQLHLQDTFRLDQTAPLFQALEYDSAIYFKKQTLAFLLTLLPLKIETKYDSKSQKSLKKSQEVKIGFIHDTIKYSYLLEAIQDEMRSTSGNSKILSNKSIVAEVELVKFISDAARHDLVLTQHLRKAIDLTKSDKSESAAIYAANSITILVAAHYSFTCQDLSNVNIRGANIKNGIFSGADFSGADLSYANLGNIQADDAKFVKTKLKAAKFGVLPDLQHFAYVKYVSFSRNGKYIASGSYDKTVRIWDVENSKCIAALEGHTEVIVYVCFSPDEKYVASGSRDKTIKIWGMFSFKCLKTLYGHNDEVTSVCFSLDGKLVASCSSDKTVKIWKMQTSKCIANLVGHSASVFSVSFSPDGKHIASSSFDKTVKIWKMSSIKCLKTLGGHKDRALSVGFSPDAIPGGLYDTVKLWDTQAKFAAANSLFKIVSISPNGKYLASGEFGTVKLWDAQTSKCLVSLQAGRGHVSSLSFSGDGKYIVSAGHEDGTAKIWEVQTSKCLAPLCGYGFHLSSDGKYVAGKANKSVKIWDVQTSKCLATLECLSGENIECLSKDGKLIVTRGIEDKIVKIWDVQTSKLLAALTGHKKDISEIVFSWDGKYIADSEGSKVKIWEAETGKCFATFEGHEADVWCLSFSLDGKFVAAGDEDAIVKIWEVQTSRCIATLKGHPLEIQSVSFSPDGKLVASGSQDSTVKIWEVETSKCLATLKGHGHYVQSVSFSPDGKYLASGSADKTAKIWNLQTFECIATLRGYLRERVIVCFSSDGKYLTSTSVDGTARIWVERNGAWYCDKIFSTNETPLSALHAKLEQVKASKRNKILLKQLVTKGEKNSKESAEEEKENDSKGEETDEIEEELKPTLTLARNAANEFSELFLEKNIARYRELIKQKYAIKEKIKEEVPLKIESIPNDKAVSRDF